MRPLFLALLLLLPAPAFADTQENDLGAALRRLKTGPATIAGHKVDAATLNMFYGARGNTPVWTKRRALEHLLASVDKSESHGLKPSDYFFETLLKSMSGRWEWTPETELLATDALAKLAVDLHIGRVDPETLEPNWNLGKPSRRATKLELLSTLAQAKDLEAAVEEIAPGHFFYLGLRKVLEEHRGYADAGGWQPVPAGPSLKPGMTDPRVASLRTRLAVTDAADPATPETAEMFDSALEDAVKRFQIRHGLDVDGIVGPATLKALNVSAEDRVNQVRVNLERARWVLHDLGDEFVIVNIAGFSVFLVRGGEPVWTSRVIVGRPYRKTPVFKADMTYMVLNPTWTVPPTILKQDKLPAITKDPTYLTRNNMELRDSKGQRVDPETVDWASYAGGGFPYQIVQKAGDDNALGKIKMMFPNRHTVYLHDTPNRELFAKSVRTFSSGCIRVENPVELAAQILGGQDGWTKEALEAGIATGKSRTVSLKKSLPVIVMYWTVQPSPLVGVRFFEDIYARDAAVLKALDAQR